MNRSNQFPLLYIASVLALVLSALAVRPAFAAGSPPPSDTPSGVTSPSSTSSSDTGSSGGSAGTHQAADDSGKHAALARQQAAELAVTGDPRWCPSGVVPHNGGGCSGDFPSLLALVGGFNPTGNGTIWIQHGPSSANVLISGLSGSWQTFKNFSLTFHGGWNGHLGSTGLSKANPLDPYPLSTFTNVLFIHDWVGNVTLKNLQFSSAAFNEGRDYSQLEVFTAGNITLNKVQVFDAFSANGSYSAGGAQLDNTAGTGNVLVSKSLFNNNQDVGLTVSSHGSITLQSVVADLNDSVGALISNHNAPTPQPVLISKSEFNGSGDRGLEVFSDGAVTLTGLTADNNASFGVTVSNDNIFSPSVAYPVTVNGVNNFNFNQFGGLRVFSYGAIKVSKTTAHGNGSSGIGVDLDNESSFNPQPVMVLGYLNASANDSTGLDISSKGAVIVNHVTANGNGLYGAFITNTLAPSGSPSPVTLLGVNTLSGNDTGLNVESKGDIKVSNLTASFNQFYGASLDNTTSVTAARVTVAGYGRFEWNGSAGSYDGLIILSHGPVTLANLRANYNTEDGVNVSVGGFVAGHTAPTPIILTGVNQFNFNGRGGLAGLGLELSTDGKITASNLHASNNLDGGAILDNYSNWTGSGFPKNPIILGGANVFNGNLGDGLYADGNSAIVLAHVTANSNFGDGIFASAGSTSDLVTVKCSSARYNSHWNLEVDPASTIFLKGYVSYPLNQDFFHNITVVRSGC